MNSAKERSNYFVRIIWLGEGREEQAAVSVRVNNAQNPTVGDLRDALAGDANTLTGLTIDGREFAPHILLDDCPLFEGVEVGIMSDGLVLADLAPADLAPLDLHPETEATARSVVAAIGGIDSGQQIGLGAYPVVVGRSPAADLRIDHPEVSQRHLQIENRRVVDLDSGNGVTLDGQPVADRAEIAPEQRIGAGNAIVTWRLLEDDSLDIAGMPPKLAFKRPPRVLPPPPAEPFRFSNKRSEGGLFPVRAPTWATFVIPLALGLVLAVLFNPYMALFALLGPAMAVSSWLEGRGRNKKDLRSRKRQTAKDREAFKAHCQRAAGLEASRRRFEHPDPAESLRWAIAPSARLWERSRGDADFLHLSIGRHIQTPWRPPVESAEADGRGDLPEELADLRDGTTLSDVPFVADFSKGIIGIVGPRRESLARWLVMQAAVRYGPSDLKIEVAGRMATEDWSWASWLPHARFAVAEGSKNSVHGSVSPIDLPLRPSNYLQQGAGQQSDSTERLPSIHPDSPHTLAVCLHPSVGLAGDSALVLAATPDELPSDCATAIQLLDDAGRCKITNWPRVVLADGISHATALYAARRLARFEDPLTASAGLPDMISLARLLGGQSGMSADRVLQEWSRADMAAPIGWSDGQVVYLDLPSEGPHGLIAGTTGSGKSELMRCLVTSLAFTASPERLNFVLIDYKGGSAFDACASLPHVVGMVTDLDERLGERALVCLRAELAYREQFLRNAQVSSIGELHPEKSPLRAAGGNLDVSEPSPTLPRLVVVIDEFAALASELPGFLESLVDIAQRGRSLGVHLLLGTQRPAGVVSPSIRSNTNIRIGLRMLDPHDSEDVIGTPAAAAIEQGSPGRAYVRYGSGQPMPFQVASVSGISPSPSDKPVVVESRMAMQTEGSRTKDLEAWRSENFEIKSDASAHEFGQASTDLWQTENFEIKSDASGGSKASSEAGRHAAERRTDLQRLVAAIGQAWEQTESQPLRCPWPEPLPTKLYLDELREQIASVGLGVVTGAVALGLEDHPEEQTRRICLWHPAEKNLLLIGLAGSGASETLLTAVLQLAEARDASALQIFGIDYGTSNLAQLADLPHCKSILGPAEVGQRTELLEFMFEELARRQRNRAAPPQILLLIDNLGALLHALEDERDYRRIDKLARLYLDGPSWGITTVAVAESLAAVPRKFFSAATMQLLFRVSESSPFGLANIDASRLGFGRAFLIGGGSVTGGALTAAGAMTTGSIAGRGGTAGAVEVQAAMVPDLPRAISDIVQDLAELATQPYSSPKPQHLSPQESRQISSPRQP